MWGTGQSFKDISSLGLKRFACSVEGHFGVSGGFSPFSLRWFWSHAGWWPYKASWGWTPRQGMGKCLTHHTTCLSLGAEIWVYQKFSVMEKTFPPSYSCATLHLLSRRSELSRVSPLATTWNFLLLLWLFRVWSIRFGSLTVQAVKLPCPEQLGYVSAGEIEQYVFQFAAFSPHVFFLGNKGMLPLALVIYSN